MLRIIIVVLIILLSPLSTLAFDDIDTHPKLTKKAVESSKLNGYLVKNLDFVDGIETKIYPINNKSIKSIIEDGAHLEDVPVCRASNHFHNPLLDWDQSYMTDDVTTDVGSMIRTKCDYTGWPFSERKSNVTWVTKYQSPAPDGAKVTLAKQDMSWDDAREYYRLALTGSAKGVREYNFGKTFQAIGQVVHLMEDMAVPAHVRNDFTSHLVFSKFTEKLDDQSLSDWVASFFGNGFEHYVKNNPGLVSAIDAGEVKSLADSIVTSNMAITEFWDRNRYDGTNPSTTLAQGLSEYTNSNYFSRSTIFAEEKDTADVHYFPQPEKLGTYAKLVEVLVSDGQTDKVRYVTKVGSDDKLTAYSYLEKWVETTKAGNSTWAPYQLIKEKGWLYNLDDEVYKDYAKNLLPRAVAYPTGLINYFFRGEIDMVKDAATGNYIIENHSAEEMNGTCTLYYDDENENRIAVPGASWPCQIPANGKSAAVSFTAPTDPKPKEKGKYMLVFNGTLGNEDNAVIGKIVEMGMGWSYLVIKQVSFSSDVISGTYELKGGEASNCPEVGMRCEYSKEYSAQNNLNTVHFQFDFQWLGDVSRITNVTLLKIINSGCYGNWFDTVADLNDMKGHSISVSGNATGKIDFVYSDRENRYSPFPDYILVETEDKGGNKNYFFEPLFYMSLDKENLKFYTRYYSSEYLYFNSEKVSITVSAKTPDISCMKRFTGRQLLGQYALDKSAWPAAFERYEDSYHLYIAGVGYSGQTISIGKQEHYYSTDWGADAQTASVSVGAEVRIKRKWNSSAVSYFESLGYDASQLPEWDITFQGGI